MGLTLEQVSALTRRVAADVAQDLRVVGITSSDGQGGRIELLITVEGCHRDPCLVMVNVPRADAPALEDALRAQLPVLLRNHPPRP